MKTAVANDCIDDDVTRLLVVLDQLITTSEALDNKFLYENAVERKIEDDLLDTIEKAKRVRDLVLLNQKQNRGF